MTHSEEKTACITLITACGGWATGTFTGTGRFQGHGETGPPRNIKGCTKGTADVIGCCGSIAIQVEVKTKSYKKQSSDQVAVQKQFESAGGVYLLGLAALRDYLRSRGILEPMVRKAEKS